MQRRQLIELHEQPWFPRRFRTLFQKLMGRMQRFVGMPDAVAELLIQCLERTGAESVLELCSGSGEVGAEIWARAMISTQGKILVLSDINPPLDEYHRLRSVHGHSVDYLGFAVDARHVVPGAPRFRMMINSFHHFSPRCAREILADSVAKADGILIVEGTARSAASLAKLVLFAPLLPIVAGFLLQPWRPSQLFWGLLVPVVPVTAMFDGVVSCLRSYNDDEILEFVAAPEMGAFDWETGRLTLRGGGAMATYLVGTRRRVPRACEASG